ncbi:AraC family transcriptional regulator [Ancylobacter sp. FA202]|uniref:AraC family transcriptional regulator n=1 Tax=Ancylobacter sp. FA202 TaxID=1111106 RepID=UPI000366B5ED|nr:AraC family transcriptional regulator [Ancylobacter sp. FA202]
MPKNAAMLHPLAFGNRTKMQSTSLLSMQEQVHRMLGWSAEYDAIGDASTFATQQASITVNGLKLSGLSHSPLRTRVESNELSFFMPVEGGAIRSTVNGKLVECHVRTNALLAPEGERIGEGGYRSILVAGLDRSRLLQTAGAMLGRDEMRVDLGAPSVMPLVAAGVNFDLMLRGACSLLEASNLSGEAAARLGVDEIFYRAICGMLLRDRLFGETGDRSSGASADRRLERACDYVMANLDRRITLTDLEAISGLSARNLQYAFQKRFGCTPVTWIRNERLNAARDLLLAGGDADNVTTAALAFCFSNLGSFSRHYRERFGEYPAVTLAAARGRSG